MDSRPTVYIVSDTGHNFDAVNKRGNPVFLFTEKINVFASDQLVKDIGIKLKDSKEGDMLVPSGNALAVCVAYAMMLLKHERVNVLLYSFKHEEYELRSITLSQLASQAAPS